MGHIILGLAMIAAGLAIAIKSEAIYSAIGPIQFFEKYLGTEGGSRLGYKLLGILIFILGVIAATNMMGDLLNWILSPLINASR